MIPTESPGTGEPRETALRRLKMRSMRRGIKEMDLILSGFAGRHLDGMDAAGLAAYDALLCENDQDLYRWVTGQEAAPGPHADMIARIAADSEAAGGYAG